MPISQADLTAATANEAARDLRRLSSIVTMMRRIIIAHGLAGECPECAGKGYPGVASLTNCATCQGSGMVLKP